MLQRDNLDVHVRKSRHEKPVLREQRQSQQSQERYEPAGSVDDDSDNYVVLTKTKFDFQQSVM